MKKPIILIAMFFAIMSARAQENHILYTLFEPDSCTYIVPNYDTLKWDLNQDGVGDVLLYSQYHDAGGTMTFLYTAPNWKWCFIDETSVDTIMINENLQWNTYHVMLIIPEVMSPYWAFRHQTEDGIHYGWMYITEKYYCLDCISSMGYCTLPDTPIQWGQTELWGVEENDADDFATLHPNPTTGIVRVEGMEITEVLVYNAMGQLVKTVQNTNEISMEGLSQGVYLLHLTTKDGKVLSDKVVKE